MAGSYDDYPAPRMALNDDGSVLVKISNTNTITDITSASDSTINNESSDAAAWIPTSSSGTWRMAWIFPELRDVVGYFISASDWFNITLDWSADTTNGVDGTWTTVTTDATAVEDVDTNPGYRTVASMSASGAKAVRISQSPAGSFAVTLSAFHLFGQPSSSSDRLELWHPTLDQRIGPAAFDWGDVPQGGTADVTFRVKNRSATLTASTITVSVDTITDTTPAVSAQHTLSDDGTNFAATESISSLAPGAISSVLTLRRTTPSNATLGLWTFRVKAVAASWA